MKENNECHSKILTVNNTILIQNLKKILTKLWKMFH